MKVGDLVKHRFRKRQNKVFLVVKTAADIDGEIIWLYPDPDGNPDYDHTDDDNYYFKDFFEVVSESR